MSGIDRYLGKGVYLADISSKSANYCVPEESGNEGLLLLCEAELGKMFEYRRFEYDAKEMTKEAGCLSSFGIGMTRPRGWVDAGKVHESLRGVLMVCDR